MDFIQRDTVTIAKDLLGVRVIYHDELQTYTGYIVETEAYVGKKIVQHTDLMASERPKLNHYIKPVVLFTHT